MPKDFGISDPVREWAHEKCPTVNLDQELEKFCDYWHACGKRMMDWDATFRNWLRRVPQFARAAPKERWKPDGLH